jgi:hypothetical protein
MVRNQALRQRDLLRRLEKSAWLHHASRLTAAEYGLLCVEVVMLLLNPEWTEVPVGSRLPDSPRPFGAEAWGVLRDEETDLDAGLSRYGHFPYALEWASGFLEKRPSGGYTDTDWFWTEETEHAATKARAKLMGLNRVGFAIEHWVGTQRRIFPHLSLLIERAIFVVGGFLIGLLF